MAKFYTELDDSLRRFIAEQKIFFTASAPNDGRVNLSPKGMDSFRCLDRKTVAYLDLTGSGNETAAHIFENGRLTIMFCSFTEKPLILRLYGRGRVVRKNDEDWNRLYSNFTPIIGERQIIVLEIESLQTSCGFAVPVYELKEEREKLVEWAENKGENGLLEYRRTKNQISIDGLPTHLNG
ncbi:MAG TPA: pyridoxamine 5'-phosphate oxidase family protein [Pyrinomonadaceae bacterium]|jgi:hypothetical protein